jgi:uncharacterized membrane protein
MQFLDFSRDGVPLHPALVHVPLGLAMAVPLVALLVLLGTWRGWFPRRAWLLVVVLQGVMLVGGAAAYNTGEKEGDLVGGIVEDAPVEAHEEAAEVFMLVAAGSFVFSLVLLFFESNGLVPLGYVVATALAGVVLLLGARLGHLGGRLVYIHGAADAHKPDATGQDTKSSED